MSPEERLVWAWSTAWAVAFAVVYLWSYWRPDHNRMTRFLTRWSDRRFGRWQIAGRAQMLVLGVLFACLAVAGMIVTRLGLRLR
jgi:hypothetical protein